MKKDAKFSIAILLLLLVLIIVSTTYAFYEVRINKNGNNTAIITIKNGSTIIRIVTAGDYSATLSGNYVIFDEWLLTND